jgi:hypothetical protein
LNESTAPSLRLSDEEKARLLALLEDPAADPEELRIAKLRLARVQALPARHMDAEERPAAYPPNFTPDAAIGKPAPQRRGLTVVGGTKRDQEPELTYELVFKKASQIAPEEVRWLWPGYFVDRAINILVGDPGAGKSTLTTDIVARVTTGAEWPGPVPRALGPARKKRRRRDRNARPFSAVGTPAQSNKPGRVLYFNCEESKSTSIIPRLIRGGANLDLVEVHDCTKRSDGVEFGFSLRRDIDTLTRAVTNFGDVRLIVIDPITAYLEETNASRDNEVRQLLQPLVNLADKQGICVLLLAHLNKNTAEPRILYRLANSIAFGAIARMIWFVSKHPFVKGARALTFCKGNIDTEEQPTGITMRREQGRLVYDRDPIDFDSDEIAAHLAVISARQALAARGGPLTPLELAREFLGELLIDPGDVLYAEAWKGAKAQGIRETTFRKAVDQLIEEKRMVKELDPRKARTYWLRPAPDEPDPPADPPADATGPGEPTGGTEAA